MANQRQDFLRKIGKGWTPTHMNLNRPKVAFHNDKKEDDADQQKIDEAIINAEFSNSEDKSQSKSK